jgi:hypothetical protein
MNEDNYDDDYKDVLIGSEDKKIQKKKPPNDRIIFFKIPEEDT